MIWDYLLIAVLQGGVETHHSNKGKIGILYNPVAHKVVKVYANTPAAAAGLHTGDKIMHVNDKDIQGPPYTEVELTILRNGKTLIFTIERVPKEEIRGQPYLPDNYEGSEIDPEVAPETAYSVPSRADDRQETT